MNRNGTIKKKRRDELHSQLPPESSIERFKIKVTAKNIEAKMPIRIAFNETSSPLKIYFHHYNIDGTEIFRI
jgi:hypothetical protein